ncbi:hypothetical protein JCM10212_004976 [Sporobolomyces blumeae]
MDIPELANFVPRASTSSAAFPLDPALASATARPTTGNGNGNYWDEHDALDYDDDDDDDGYSQGQDDQDDESDDETDAEEEFARSNRRAETATSGGTAARAAARGGAIGGLLNEDGTVTLGGAALDKGKGKARAVDQDADDGEGEEDLGRFINAIRNSSSTGVGGTTALDREFDRSIADELDAFDPEMMDDLTVGVRGRKRRKGGKGGGRRAAADVAPSPEVQRLLFQANEAYASGALDEAIEVLSEVVRIDPIIRVSWYTLATIYEEQGEREKAIQCKIVATHLSGQKSAAGDWADLGTESRDLGLLHQAIYCFTQAVKANKEDVDSMWDRAYLLKMSGATKMAIRAFQALLELLPHDPGVLRELAPLLASSHLYPQAVQLLLSAFSYYRETVPEITTETSHLLNSYGYEDLETLADFLLAQKRYAECVRVVRQGVRWMQGRERETEWDTVLDDREYDVSRQVRDGWEKGNQWLEREPTYELDVRLRTRLGIARLWMGDHDEWVGEAQRHFELVLDEDVAQFPELFDAIGDAYVQKGMPDKALEMFTVIAECDETNGPNVWFKIGQCHAATGDYQDARECFENVLEEEPSNLEAKVALARVYESLGEPERALTLIKQVMQMRRRMDLEEGGGDARQRRRSTRTTDDRRSAHQDTLALEEERNFEASAAFRRLAQLDPLVEQGDDDATFQWLEIATRMVDSFRSTRQLFPSDFRKKFVGMRRRRAGRRKKGVDKDADLDDEADEMASRLQRSMITDEDDEIEETAFRGKEFDEWVDFILKYCFLLTKSGELELAAEVLLHVREASVFRQDKDKEEALRFGLIACFHHAGRHDQVVAEFRWFQNQYSYQTEPIRLLLSLLGKGHGATIAFNEHRLQKYLVRQLKEIGNRSGNRRTKDDDAEMQGATPEASANGRSSPVAVRGRRQSSAAADDEEADDGDEDDEDFGGASGANRSSWSPTILSPVFFATYGFMLMNSSSFQSAIIYLLRAYDLDKDQPLVNLALATSYLQRAMSRQTDNRQHQIAQALAFLCQYKKLKGPCQETEYNFARAFHHLGLQPQAVKHYRACLALALPTPPAPPSGSDHLGNQDGLRDYGSLTKAAAYNLMILLSASGQDQEAKRISEEYLAM